MSKTTVIFVLSPKEAEYAVKYCHIHPDEKVKILSPDIPAQIKLRHEGFFPHDYFIKKYFSKDFFTARFKDYEEKAVKWTQSVLRKVVEVFPEYRNYILPLQNRLELAFVEVISAYEFYQQIRDLWQPSKFLLCQKYLEAARVDFSTYDPMPSQAHLIFSFFVPAKKRKTYQIVDKFSSIEAKIGQIISGFGSPISWWEKIQALVYRYLDLIKYKFYKPAKVDILVYSGGRNLDCYYRVFHLLNLQRKPISYQVISYPQLLEEELRVRRHRINFIPLAFMAKGIKKQKISNIQKKVYRDINDWLNKSELNDTFDKKLSVSVKNALLFKTKQIFHQYLAKNIKQYVLAKKILTLYHPKLVITTHDPGPRAMPFVLAAQEEGMKTLVFMHGWQDTVIGVNYHSEIQACWGPYTANWYVKNLNKKPELVKAVGYPAFDDLFLKKEAFWQKNKSISSLSSPIKLSLLLTMYLPNTALMSLFLDDFFKSFSEVENQYQLAIRTHPGQKTDGLRELAQSYSVKVKVNPPVSLEDFIKSSDIILSWDTTAMFWAFIYGKPVFYCAPNWSSGITPVKQLGGAWLIEDAADLFRKIEKIRQNPKILVKMKCRQFYFLQQIIGDLEGKASQKHFLLIEEILRKLKK